ncbi:MAG: hypothetical protein NTY30_04105, partial [Candidatus Berkelbacteria bacterium]|nr:hypothetical protein [Candidatus Berkelbacteria bacterium]
TNLKAKLFFLVSVSVFALAALVLTLFNYNPFKSDISVFILFYLSFWASITGILTAVLLFVRSRLSEKLLSSAFWPTLRISTIISLAVTVLLVLAGLRILDLWVGAPITIAIVMLELFFRGNRYRKA